MSCKHYYGTTTSCKFCADEAALRQVIESLKADLTKQYNRTAMLRRENIDLALRIDALERELEAEKRKNETLQDR